MEIRLAGRQQDSGGVADEACSLLLREAVDRWVDSVMVGGQDDDHSEQQIFVLSHNHLQHLHLHPQQLSRNTNWLSSNHMTLLQLP